MGVAVVAVQEVEVALHSSPAAVAAADPMDRSPAVERPAQAEVLLVVEELDRQNWCREQGVEQHQAEEEGLGFANHRPIAVVHPSKDYPSAVVVKMNQKKRLQFRVEEEQMKEVHCGPSIHRNWVLPSRDQVVHSFDDPGDHLTID